MEFKREGTLSERIMASPFLKIELEIPMINGEKWVPKQAKKDTENFIFRALFNQNSYTNDLARDMGITDDYEFLKLRDKLNKEERKLIEQQLKKYKNKGVEA